ncbi:hypothetical protein OZ410_14140 [Robiginitalea sp. M366]|uniref:hypothetical protein n=1 Tax=Robiginitalea aestuariiviva TaxID=3036903 RepID=UPI00240D254A|nr:hypothetical protein [Robiginitalea aestuariiviva]MDG1573466.1 hypothetical protein [Robiginitalea aestuariiviva]
MMKTRITLLGILAAACLLAPRQATAQDPDSREKIKALQVAFFTERLELSPQEATVFWPMYNAYEKKKEALRNQEIKEIRNRLASGEAFGEREAQDILERYLALEQEQDALDRRFYRDLAKTLSASKTLKLFKAEHDFRRRLLREFRKRGGNMP